MGLITAGWGWDGIRASCRAVSCLWDACPGAQRRALQSIVSKHSAQFRGNAQHDALEFLLWLLDRMHEDLGAASPAQGPCATAEVGVPALNVPVSPARCQGLV